jgi:hypothetical protein
MTSNIDVIVIRVNHLEHHNVVYRREPERLVILRIVSPRRGAHIMDVQARHTQEASTP